MAKSPLSAVTKEDLEALYADSSIAKIADTYGVNSEAIRQKMIGLGIPRRQRGGLRTFNPSREELAELYQSLSMSQIAKRHDVGETVVWKRLREFGIKLRGYESGGHRKKPGRSFTKEHRKALSRAHMGRHVGEKNARWKDNSTERMLRLRRSTDYAQWKREALEMRGGACQRCGVKKGAVCPCCGHRASLHVHHVESFAKFPERRFDPSNSEVLCSKCHYEHHHGKPGELLETPNA